jgi:spore cortex formation protein SpoVR/YcgB (stage V sporulation)
MKNKISELINYIRKNKLVLSHFDPKNKLPKLTFCDDIRFVSKINNSTDVISVITSQDLLDKIQLFMRNHEVTKGKIIGFIQEKSGATKRISSHLFSTLAHSDFPSN